MAAWKLVRLELFKMDLQELRSHVIDIKWYEVIVQGNRVKLMITPCPSSSLVSNFCAPFVVFDGFVLLTALIDLSPFPSGTLVSKLPLHFFPSHAETVQPA